MHNFNYCSGLVMIRLCFLTDSYYMYTENHSIPEILHTYKILMFS